VAVGRQVALPQWQRHTIAFANPGAGLQLAYDGSNQDQGLLVLSWERLTAVDSHIGYAIFDNTHKLWSQPLTLEPPVSGVVTGTSTMVTHISLAYMRIRRNNDKGRDILKLTFSVIAPLRAPSGAETIEKASWLLR